ncbi:hemoglobin [Nonomuraea maritima]|uniref:Hemoglobin n=1 Tax=Nonomuraea maritima TaxID=683260 RepID=A0A1G9DFX0_9ACTN|nr:group II truncated hemoglobin [Nonomuraea maritima]SDK62776.1 hemoglobin [Nonomuraea maritima]
MSRTSIFEGAGGEPALLALAAAHHRRCLLDPVLNHPFSRGTRPDHVRRLAAYWAEVFGGPARASAEVPHSAMLALHAGNGMESDMGERFLACFLAAIDDAGLPDDPELRRALRAYMEWAIDDVLSYSPPGSEVPAGLPVPRWSWNGLEER